LGGQSLLDSLDEEAQFKGEVQSKLLHQVRGLLTAFRVSEATQAAEAFVERWPESGWARVALAWTLAERGQWWDAFQAYDEALAIDAALNEGHLHQGRFAAVRANAKAERELIEGDSLDPTLWTPFLGGSWEQGDEPGEVVARLQGLIDQGLCGALWHEPVPSQPYSVSVEVSLAPVNAPAGAGLAIGLPDARSGIYLVLRSWPERDLASNPDAVAFRRQHGAWPKTIQLCQIQGDVSGTAQQWTVPLPDQGWLRLQAQVKGPALTLTIGDQTLPPLTSGGVSGRLGLIKLEKGEARYRNFSLTTEAAPEGR
jgi:tetratricopeptide (TPR) repeat protein